MHQLLIVHVTQGLATSVKISPLAERDHVLHRLTQSLGSRPSGVNPPVADQLRRQTPQQRLTLVGWQVQLLESLPVPHHSQGAVARRGLALADGESGEGRLGCDASRRPDH